MQMDATRNQRFYGTQTCQRSKVIFDYVENPLKAKSKWVVGAGLNSTLPKESCGRAERFIELRNGVRPFAKESRPRGGEKNAGDSYNLIDNSF